MEIKGKEYQDFLAKIDLLLSAGYKFTFLSATPQGISGTSPVSKLIVIPFGMSDLEFMKLVDHYLKEADSLYMQLKRYINQK